MNPSMILYSSDAREGEFVNWNDSSIPNRLKNFPNRLMVFTHGYLDSVNRSDTKVWMLPAKETLLNQTDPPAVIFYDWR